MNPPTASEEQAPEKLTEAPSKVRDTVWEAAKPEPVMVSVLPTMPEVGVRAMAEMTVKGAEAELVASLTETV